jgi:hypothetical protein
MTRRDKGTGSIAERSPGVYRLRVYVGQDPVTRRPRYSSKTIRAKNITAARKALAGFVVEQRSEAIGTNATVERLAGPLTG